MRDGLRFVALRLCAGTGLLWCVLSVIALAMGTSNLQAQTARAQTPPAQKPAAQKSAAHPSGTQKADSECLICHGQKDLQSAAGKSAYVNETTHQSGAHAKLRCTECHSDIREFPHPEHVHYAQCSTCHAQEAQELPASVHAVLGDDGCASCHGSAHEVRRAAAVAAQLCGACHAGERTEFLASAHGAAMGNGDPQSPTCTTCHGPVHKILAAEDPLSPVAKQNQPATCGECHANMAFLARHQIPFAHPVQSYQASAHGRAVAAGNLKAASCSDCHTAHAIRSARDAQSSVNHWNVPATCGACHGEIAKTYGASVHGQAATHGVIDSPVCTDCHGDHEILAAKDAKSLVNARLVSFETCGRCHGDERIAARYDLPTDRLSTFANSFHGLAARGGVQNVANCASCHGVHNIFPAADPRSTVNAANLARTCGACHEGAGQTFPIGPIHVSAAEGSLSAQVRWIRQIYWILIPLTLGFMLFHHGVDFAHKVREGRRRSTGPQIVRMNLNFRIAHWLTAASFPVLVFTGFALRYPEAWWARPLLLGEGRSDFRGTLHRAAAVLLLASLAYHVVHLLLVRQDRAHWRDMLPAWKDFSDLRGMLLYNLGFYAKRPVFGRFNYVEKLEYCAFVWGVVIMTITGLTLWFNNFALRYFPGWIPGAATALHFYEAVLATSAVVIWHMYSAVFDPEVYPMDSAWLNGKVPAAHLSETRPAYAAEAMREAASSAPQEIEPADQAAPQAEGKTPAD